MNKLLDQKLTEAINAGRPVSKMVFVGPYGDRIIYRFLDDGRIHVQTNNSSTTGFLVPCNFDDVLNCLESQKYKLMEKYYKPMGVLK